MPATYLTKEGFQKLQDELDYLRKAKRQEVAERLHEAMEGGELIENAEYEAAKNEQAFVEGRIQELELLLATAHLIEEHHDPSSVQVGDSVVVQIDDGDSEEYTIVGAAEADPRAGKISNESPLGKSLLNHHPGDVFMVEAPGGSFKVKLLKTT
jgi:transcription elongation factor GreA